MQISDQSGAKIQLFFLSEAFFSKNFDYEWLSVVIYIHIGQGTTAVKVGIYVAPIIPALLA